MKDLNQRVLMVDDEPDVLRAYVSALSAYGWTVETAASGEEALGRLRDQKFGVIVSDIAMPNMDGLALLRALRRNDPDVHVVMMTGGRQLDDAVRALEYGAFRFLLKPVEPRVLDEILQQATQLHAIAIQNRETLDVAAAEQGRRSRRAGIEARFAMATKLLWMAYQPIVVARDHDVFGYEALVRSYEPSMRTARDVVEAAEQLGRVCELGRVTRARVSADRARAAPATTLFVNVHPQDLVDEELYASDSPLTRIASSVVLEFTERASLDGVPDLGSRVDRLRAMGFRIALDDLGAGYAGLNSFSHIKPDIAKIDMFLVRDIDREQRRQRIVRSLVQLCGDLGTLVVAEGVETVAERDTLIDLGCPLLQGYLFARPENGFVEPCWGGLGLAPTETLWEVRAS